MQRLLFKSYIQAIENSVNTNLFRNFYIEEGGVERDVMNNGEFSGAYFVSGLLRLFNQQKKPHATVASTVRDLEEQQLWVKLSPVSELEQSDVVLFEAAEFPEEPGVFYQQLGFYLSNEWVVLNDYKSGCPQKTKLNLDNRKIEAVYRGKDQFDKLPQPELEESASAS